MLSSVCPARFSASPTREVGRCAPHGKRRAANVARAAIGALTLLCAAQATHASQPQWFMQTGGLSHHFQQTQAAGHAWQEQHPGLGFERRSDGLGASPTDWSWSTSGGLMQDSRGFWSTYAGAAYQRQWKGPAVETGLGLGAYAFYRSASWNGRMALVPALMPVATLHLPAVGMSLNLAYVPRIAAYNSAMPSVLHVQVGFRLP